MLRETVAENILQFLDMNTGHTLSRYLPSFFAQLRLGIMTLEIQTGRDTLIRDKYTKMNRKDHVSDRLCALCKDM